LALSAVLKGAQGAPVLPHNVLGSISHKDKYAAAIAATTAAATDGQQEGVIESLGVDLELAASSKRLIGRRILTENETKNWSPALPPHVCEVKLRFSIKEALYKALFRHIPRHIGFREVEVFPGERHNEATVKLLMPDPVAAKLHVTAQWKLVLQDQYILSAVRVMREG
jgi:4'-phosphopantetheinyl transferase EntD